MRLALWARTALLLAFLTALFMCFGYLIAGFRGAVVALLFSLFLDFFSFWYSDKIVLAMYGAEPCEDEELNKIVEKLAKEARIPKPKVYVCDLPVANAFATGRSPKQSAVCVTRKLLELLDKDELEGVLAHEIAHIKNRDVLISTLAAVLAGAIGYLANLGWFAVLGEDEERSAVFLPLIIFAPLAATLVQLAISREREFLADYTGAAISRKPLALANALRKLTGYAQADSAEINPGTAHMFIVNPLSGESIARLFSTHPPVEERIKKLEELAKKL